MTRNERKQRRAEMNAAALLLFDVIITVFFAVSFLDALRQAAW